MISVHTEYGARRAIEGLVWGGGGGGDMKGHNCFSFQNSQDLQKLNHVVSPHISKWICAPGGGGGTQMLFGRGCAAEASKPVPIFKGHFGGKEYPLLGVWRKRVPIIRDF